MAFWIHNILYYGWDFIPRPIRNICLDIVFGPEDEYEYTSVTTTPKDKE